MHAIDTNILVYAHREEFAQHKKAKEFLMRQAAGSEPWVLFWPCLYEFLRVVTHPKLFDPSTPVTDALAAVAALLSNCTAVLAETEKHGQHLETVLRESPCRGNHMIDVHIVALMREHGIDTIITTDRDFLQFKGIKVVNPL